MTNTNCSEYSIKIQYPDDGQYVCPKHVELYTKIKLRNSLSCKLLLYEYITMHGLRNVKLGRNLSTSSTIKRNEISFLRKIVVCNIYGYVTEISLASGTPVARCKMVHLHNFRILRKFTLFIFNNLLNQTINIL